MGTHTVMSLLTFRVMFYYCSYNMRPTTSQEVRRAVERESAVTFSEKQKEGVALYLSNTTAVPKRRNRKWMAEALVATATLLDSLVVG